MKEKKYYIALDDFERRVVVNCMNEMRNKLIADGKYTDALDEVLLKTAAPLTVVNTRGFDLPETGDNGTMMFTVFGILAMAGAAAVIVLASRKKRNVR